MNSAAREYSRRQRVRAAANAREPGQPRKTLRHAGGQRFDLQAAAFSADRPLDEVFAVVGEQPVTVFADARTSTFDDFLAEELRCHPRLDRVSLPEREFFERHFLDRKAREKPVEAAVVNDPAIARVHAMMKISPSWRRQVRSEGKIIQHDIAPGCFVFVRDIRDGTYFGGNVL